MCNDCVLPLTISFSVCFTALSYWYKVVSFGTIGFNFSFGYGKEPNPMRRFDACPYIAGLRDLLATVKSKVKASRLSNGHVRPGLASVLVNLRLSSQLVT